MGMEHEELQSKEPKLYDFTQSEPGSRVLHYLAKEAAFLGATGVISTEIMNKMIDEGKVEVRVPEICIREGALRIDMSFDLTDDDVSSELPRSIGYDEYKNADAAERAKRELNLTIGIKWSPRRLSLRRPFGLNDKEMKAFKDWFIKLDSKYGSGAVPVELAAGVVKEKFAMSDDGVMPDTCLYLATQPGSALEEDNIVFFRFSCDLRLQKTDTALKNASPMARVEFGESIREVANKLNAYANRVANYGLLADGSSAEEVLAENFTNFFVKEIKASDLDDKHKTNLLDKVEEYVNSGLKPDEIARIYAPTKFADLVEKAKAAEKEAREKAKEAKDKEAEGEDEGESDPPPKKTGPKKGRKAYDEAMAKATVSAGDLAKYYAWDNAVSAQEAAATEALKDYLVDQKVIASRDDYVTGFQIPLLSLLDFYLSNEEGFGVPNMIDRKAKAITKKYSGDN